jgi:hypothetical protein
MMKCPGMDRQNWKPEDLIECACRGCGEKMEFWKDDIKKSCRKCNKIMFNPNLGNTCLSWCDKAEDCIGNKDIAEWKKSIEHCSH